MLPHALGHDFLHVVLADQSPALQQVSVATGLVGLVQGQYSSLWEELLSKEMACKQAATVQPPLMMLLLLLLQKLPACSLASAWQCVAYYVAR